MFGRLLNLLSQNHVQLSIGMGFVFVVGGLGLLLTHYRQGTIARTWLGVSILIGCGLGLILVNVLYVWLIGTLPTRWFAIAGLLLATAFFGLISWGRYAATHWQSASHPNAASFSTMDPNIAQEVRAVLGMTRGNKIKAIKRVRELTGMGLPEAKAYVDNVERANRDAR